MQSQDAPSPPETWTVKHGDNPWRIAKALYPDAPTEDLRQIAMQIMEANAVTRPDRIQVDQVLMIPDRSLEISDETRAAFESDASRISALTQTQQQLELPPAAMFPNLFIFGGAWDGYGPRPFQADNAKRLEYQFAGSTSINHQQYGKDSESIIATIADQYERTRQPIDLIGHSWGGMDAYDVALALSARGIPVRTLVTVDPVGRRGRGDLPENINWINIAADQRHPFSIDNIVAAIGGKPSALPIQDADQNTLVAADHKELGEMISSTLTSAPERTRVERLLGLTPNIDRLQNRENLPSVRSILEAETRR